MKPAMRIIVPRCWYCGRNLTQEVERCRHCGESNDPDEARRLQDTARDQSKTAAAAAEGGES